jgi:hypothetical protein
VLVSRVETTEAHLTATVTYFGEDAQAVSGTELFSRLHDFIAAFESATAAAETKPGVC